MLIGELTPRPEHRQEVGTGNDGPLPETPACYAATDAGGTILYLGKTVNLERRIREHLYGDTGRGPGPRTAVIWWLRRPAAELAGLESWWLEQHRRHDGGNLPPGNRIEAPRN